MSYYKTRQIYPWLYSLYDPEHVYCYVLVGEKQALLYDTAYGVGSLPEAVAAITPLPVTVVLGHGHIDHANGAYQFDEVHLHEDDFELCRLHTSPGFRKGAPENAQKRGARLPDGFDADAYINAGTGNLKKLEVGTVFDLGGLTVETVAMPGHTKGSVALLVKEKRVLLVSDAANDHVWMFLEESLPLRDYVAMLERIYPLAFDTFIVGHSDEPKPKEDMLKYMQVARNARIDKAEPYPHFEELHPYLYTEDGVAIAFSERTLNG